MPEQLLLATDGGCLFTGAVETAAVPAFTVALLVVLAVAERWRGARLVTTDPGGGLRFESRTPGSGGVLACLDVPRRSLRVAECVSGSAGFTADDGVRASLGRRRASEELPLMIVDGGGPAPQGRPAPAFAPRLEPVADLSRGQATSLLRMLPRAGVDATVWALPTARSLLLGAAAHPEAVAVRGAARLTVLRPLVRHATGLRVLSAAVGSPDAASAWELTTPALRLTITLGSPAPEPVQAWTLANTTTLSR